MTANVESTQESDAQNPSKNVLLRAVQALDRAEGDRPSVDEMVAALVYTEKQHKQSKASHSLPSLLGTWRFRFGANRKSRLVSGVVQGGGFYVPGWIQATLAFAIAHASTDDAGSPNESPDASALTITNALQLGGVRLELTGPAKYLPRRNLMAFDFHTMTLSVFGWRLYSGRLPGRFSDPDEFEQRAIAKLPFFAFIAATDDYIAARGRGGGLALWSQG
jgi:hypothetical protein